MWIFLVSLGISALVFVFLKSFLGKKDSGKEKIEHDEDDPNL